MHLAIHRCSANTDRRRVIVAHRFCVLGLSIRGFKIERVESAVRILRYRPFVLSIELRERIQRWNADFNL